MGLGKGLLLPAAAAVALSLPAVAGAAPGDRGRFYRGEERRDWRHDDRHDDRHDHRHDGGKRVDIDIRIGSPPPRYETREVRVWVPPVYRTVVDRKWVEPVYRTEVDRVWVPERVEEREVRYRHRGHWHTRVERVVVEPGCWKTVERRVCVSEGRWETCERQELVRAGYYEVRHERVARPYRVSPFGVVNPMLGRVGVAGL
jgi:hypothetical protein